jgi:WD40 repeat protein
MLPDFCTKKLDPIATYRKSFTDSLCDGYQFDVKACMNHTGTRSIFYYKHEHTLIISHISSNRVHLINFLTGKIRWFDHHGTTVRNVQVSNHEIISASWDGTVCVTNFDTLKLRLVLTEKSMGRSPMVMISQDGRFVYSYSYDSDKNPGCTSNTVRKWTLADGALNYVIQLPGYHRTIRRCGACIEYNELLYVVSDSGYLQVFNASNGKIEEEYYCDEELQNLCIVPSLNMILIAGNKGNFYLYDISCKRITLTIKGHEFEVRDILLHPFNQQVFFSISSDGTLKVWKIPDLKLLAAIDVHNNYLWSFDIVNNLILTGGEEGDIWIYDIKDLQNIILKGKLEIFDQAYMFESVDPNSFYTNDLSILQASRKKDETPVNGPFVEHLLNSCNNFKLMQDLFCSNREDSKPIGNYDKIFLQIPQSFL